MAWLRATTPIAVLAGWACAIAHLALCLACCVLERAGAAIPARSHACTAVVLAFSTSLTFVRPSLPLELPHGARLTGATTATTAASVVMSCRAMLLARLAKSLPGAVLECAVGTCSACREIFVLRIRVTACRAYGTAVGTVCGLVLSCWATDAYAGLVEAASIAELAFGACVIACLAA